MQKKLSIIPFIILVIVYHSYNASKMQSAPTDPAGINSTLNTMSPPPPSASDQIAKPQMPMLPETPQIQPTKFFPGRHYHFAFIAVLKHILPSKSWIGQHQ